MHRITKILLSIGLSVGISTAAMSQQIELATPTVGSRFEYLWSYGGRDTFTIVGTNGGRLQARLEQDFEDDGVIDEIGLQYWDLNSRLWLAHVGLSYATIYAPSTDAQMPTALFDGLYFSGTFDLMTIDDLTTLFSTWSQVISSCDYLRSKEMAETPTGLFSTLEIACTDNDVSPGSTITDDPAPSYQYSELWSLELGMPVVQSFGIDQSTGEAEDFSLLVAYSLN